MSDITSASDISSSQPDPSSAPDPGEGETPAPPAQPLPVEPESPAQPEEAPAPPGDKRSLVSDLLSRLNVAATEHIVATAEAWLDDVKEAISRL